VNQTERPDLSRVRAAARKIRDQIVNDPLALAARLEDPIPVHTAAGELDSWFVALTAENCLLGFLQLEPDLNLHRYSTFQRMPGNTRDCPPAASWLDPETIRERARSVAAASDQLGDPILSYQGNRDRIAWRVPIITDNEATIYVVGDHAYKHPGERDSNL
jgi:hypothetical protein